MKKLMFVSLCAAILSFGIVNQVQSSVITPKLKKEVPATKVVYTCSMHSVIVSDKAGKCPVCKMDLMKKTMSKKDYSKLVYSCSMHSIVKSAKPGKCPICKMDLVKK